MSERVVCDASALVALLVTSTRSGAWAAERLRDVELVAPQHVLVESANVFRRLELAATISGDAAAQAHGDLLALPIELWPYEELAAETWRLRGRLSIYDAVYVVLAAEIDATLVTLDKRLAKAPGLPCAVAIPPE